MFLRVQCPVCQRTVTVNRNGCLSKHMWVREVPRKKRGKDDPFAKDQKAPCPASGLSETAARRKIR
jgi:hypothetical protein